jgi:hypothetical protein
MWFYFVIIMCVACPTKISYFLPISFLIFSDACGIDTLTTNRAYGHEFLPLDLIMKSTLYQAELQRLKVELDALGYSIFATTIEIEKP